MPTSVSNSSETTLTVHEAARVLRVNPKTLYAAIKRNELPARRIGRKVIISKKAFTRWLAGEAS